MASTFSWPVHRSGRDKRPDELTDGELYAWKSTSFYPNRFPPGAQAGESTSNVGQQSSMHRPSAPPLSDNWAAAQQAFDAKNRSTGFRQPTQKENVAPKHSLNLPPASVVSGSARSNVNKTSWDDAQAAFDGKHSTGRSNIKQENIDPRVSASGALPDNVKKPEQSSVPRASWGDAQAKFDAQHGNTLHDRKQKETSSHLSWGQSQSRLNTESSSAYENPTTRGQLSMKSATANRAQGAASTVSESLQVRPQETKQSVVGTERKAFQGGMSNSHWADPQASLAQEQTTMPKQRHTASGTLALSNTRTKPYNEKTTDDRVTMNPQSPWATAQVETLQPPPENLHTSGSKTSHTAPGQLPPHLRQYAAGQKDNLDENYRGPGNTLNDASLSAFNPQNKEDPKNNRGGSVVSKSSALMNSRWAPTGFAAQPVTIHQNPPVTRPLRSDAPAYQTVVQQPLQSETPAHALSSKNPYEEFAERCNVTKVRATWPEKIPQISSAHAGSMETFTAEAAHDEGVGGTSVTHVGPDFRSAAAKEEQASVSAVQIDARNDAENSVTSSNPQVPAGYKLSPHPWNGPTTMPKKAAIYKPQYTRLVENLPNTVLSNPAAILETPATRPGWTNDAPVELRRFSVAHDVDTTAAVVPLSQQTPKQKEESTVSNNNPTTESSAKEWSHPKHATLHRPKYMHELSPDEYRAYERHKSAVESELEVAPIPDPTMIALQAIQKCNIAVKTENQEQKLTEIQLKVENNAWKVGENATKLQTTARFDPKKYGSPRKVLGGGVAEQSSQVVDGSQRKPTGTGVGFKFDISSVDTDAFAKQMESERNENPKGKIYRRVGNPAAGPTHPQDDGMFGRRSDVQIWSENAAEDVLRSRLIKKMENGEPKMSGHDTSAVGDRVVTEPAQITPTKVKSTIPSIEEKLAKLASGGKILPVDREDILKHFMDDLKTKDKRRPGAIPLTSHQLALATGERQSASSHADSFDQKVSDTGIGKQDVRATWGVDPAEEFIDFDGSRLPAPVDWHSRRPFVSTGVPDFIKTWATDVDVIQPIDTSGKKFLEGTHTISYSADGKKTEFLPPLTHEQTLPSVGDPPKVAPTALAAIASAKNNHTAQYDDAIATANLLVQRRQEVETREPELSPFGPTVKMYMRVAYPKDAVGLTAIYNHYIQHTIIPEDQKAIEPNVMARCIENCRKNELPFIVAVKGDRPLTKDAQGKASKPDVDIILPQHETILGFAFAEVSNFGIGGLHTGRSRCNAVLQLYVDHKYQQKGVGRNLLDRMMHIVSDAYAHQDAVPWMSPPNRLANTYDSSKACRWHSLFFCLPMEKDDEPTFVRTSNFLHRFYFQKEHVFKAAARTSIEHGAAKFKDVAIFGGTALNVDAFGPFA